jgi:hypothetical protein
MRSDENAPIAHKLFASQDFNRWDLAPLVFAGNVLVAALSWLFVDFFTR